jgi:alkylhydroperoxidase family enzyme
MAPRLPEINTHIPEIPQVAAALAKATGNGSLPPTTISLIYLRAGQIVGNTYQVMRHSTDLRNAGEPETRIAAVASWWDAPYFTDAERAALTLTDAVFHPSAPGHERVSDDLFTEIAKHHDDKALSTLTMVLASAGFWMNVALILKPPPTSFEAKPA